MITLKLLASESLQVHAGFNCETGLKHWPSNFGGFHTSEKSLEAFKHFMAI